MSTAQKVSALPAVTDMTGRTVLVAEGDALKRINPGNLMFVDLQKKEVADTTISLNDFMRKYVSGKPVGTILGDSVHSTATEWKVNIGNVSLPMQHYFCFVARNVRAWGDEWNSVTLIFFPVQTTVSAMYQVSLSTNSDTNVFRRVVNKLCEGTQILSDTVSMGGGITSYPIGCYDLSEGRWRHECDKNSCGDAERSSDSKLCFGSFDSLVQYIGRTCQDWKEDSSERIKQRKSRCERPYGDWCDLSAEYGMHKLPDDRYQRSNSKGQRSFIFLSRSGIFENKHRSLFVYQKLQKWSLEQMVQSPDGESHHIADRKEVVAA